MFSCASFNCATQSLNFLLLRFAMVFAWSMQFIVIEAYSITKDPLQVL
jgi:hypothetical protein